MNQRYPTPPVVEHSAALITCIFIIVLGLVFGLARCDPAHAAPPSITPNTEAVVVNTPGVVVFPSNRQLVQTFTAATKAASVPVAVGQIGFETDTGSIYRATGTSAGNWTSTGGGGGGTWGSITGTLSDQTDLQTALNLKLASGDIDTSAELRAILTDETGTGALVFAGGNIGAATATTINGVAVASSVGSLINLSSGVEFSVAQSMTITGTGTLNINGGGTLGSAAYLNSGDILTGTVANGNVVTYTEYNGKPGSIFAKSSMWMYSDPIGGSSYWETLANGGELKWGFDNGFSWEIALSGATFTAERVVTPQDKDGALALLSNHLGEFAATTSAQLLGKLTDESGTGVLLTTNGSGASLTAINASNISSGILAAARGGTGITALGTGVATALGNTVDGASGLLTYGLIGTSGAKLGLLNTANTFAGQATFAQGTITTSKPFLVSQTWNDGAGGTVVYSGMKLAITDTSSSLNGEYFGVYAGAAGTTKLFSVEKIGGGNLVKFGSFVSTNNTFSLDFDVVGMALGSARQVSWSSTVNSYDTADLIIRRDAPATLKLGADGATAITQTIKGANGVGTDKAGFSFVTAGGQSTGTGAGGDVITRTSLTGATGSSTNSYTTRSYTRAQFINLSESSATLLANVALASSKYAGVKIVATVNAGDGTDFQSLTSDIKVDAVNKSGTVTATLVQNDGTTAATSGTLAVTYTAVANGAGFDLKCNAVSSLTQTTLRVKYMIMAINSDDVGTVTP